MWHADGRLGVVDDAVDLSELLDLDVPGEATEFVEVFSTSSSGVTLMVGWLVQEEGEEVAIFLLEKKSFFKKWVVISLLSTYSFFYSHLHAVQFIIWTMKTQFEVKGTTIRELRDLCM